MRPEVLLSVEKHRVRVSVGPPYSPSPPHTTIGLNRGSHEPQEGIFPEEELERETCFGPGHGRELNGVSSLYDASSSGFGGCSWPGGSSSVPSGS
jgi:hypothetical protein